MKPPNLIDFATIVNTLSSNYVSNLQLEKQNMAVAITGQDDFSIRRSIRNLTPKSKSNSKI